MISISSTTYDISGNITLVGIDTDARNCERRQTRTKLLNGEVFVFDGGHCHGDTTAVINNAQLTESESETIQYIFENYGEVWFSCSTGFYLAAFNKFNANHGEATIELLIKEKIG